MSDASSLTGQYDRAAGRWRDKMRALGYYDGYLGFLTAPGQRASSAMEIADIGSGTGAFAEAWVAANGAPARMTLIDPSKPMLERGFDALAARGVEADCVVSGLEDASFVADEVLVAHVIEHFDDPAEALSMIRALVRKSGRLRLVVSKPHWCNAIIWLQWRHKTFARDEILELLKRTGFAPEFEYAFPAGPPSRTSRGIVAAAV